MNKIYLIGIVFLFLTSCIPDSDNKKLVYQNIVILSDLSSRIDNKPPKDIEEIDKILKYFKTECVKPGEKIGDRSSITFSLLSGDNIAVIDVGEFKKLAEKQSFINSTGKFRNSGLDKKIEEFKAEVIETYENKRNNGLDLISVLIEKIENDQVVKNDTFLTNGKDTTFISFENHFYIFTDGYLEYRDKNTNNQFYYGIEEIKRVRNYCIQNKIDVSQALINNKSLCLIPIQSDNNKYINLHILETHERDKNELNQTYKNDKGLRDNEILEAVWRKWAIESGFKSFKWKKY